MLTYMYWAALILLLYWLLFVPPGLFTGPWK